MRPSRPASARSFSILWLNLVLTHRISRFPGRRPHILSTAMRSIPRLSGHANAYRWRSLLRVRWHRASSPSGRSNNGCCLFRFHHGTNLYAPRFSHAHYWYVLGMCDLESIGGRIIRFTYPSVRLGPQKQWGTSTLQYENLPTTDTRLSQHRCVESTNSNGPQKQWGTSTLQYENLPTTDTRLSQHRCVESTNSNMALAET